MSSNGLSEARSLQEVGYPFVVLRGLCPFVNVERWGGGEIQVSIVLSDNCIVLFEQ